MQFGILNFINGKIYDGELLNYKRHGPGKCFYEKT